jgi:preprotein translocase subunit SecA
VLINTIGLRVTKWLLTAKAKEAIENVNLEETLLSKYAESAEASLDISAMSQASHLLHTEYEDTNRGDTQVRVIQASSPSKTEYSGVWRNDPCPCGSGKKYKQCHGK